MSERVAPSWPRGVARGLVLASWSARAYATAASAQALERIARAGASDVALVVTGYLDHDRDSAVKAHPTRTASPAAVVAALERARALGLDTALKPHVDVLGGAYRGFIQPDDPARWFESYERFLVPWAELAEAAGCRSFWVGTELETMTRHPGRWAPLIARLRRAFSGPLVYAANFPDLELEATIALGRLVDLVGVDAYFPLSEQPDPTLEELVAGWEPWLEAIEAFGRATGRPVLITEVGCPSRRGAALAPWDFRSREPVDVELQGRYYEAALRALPRCAGLRGVFFWAWGLGPGGAGDGSFTPCGKPAEAVLRRFWGAPISGG